MASQSTLLLGEVAQQSFWSFAAAKDDSNKSTSLAAVLAAFIPALVSAVIFISVFILIRDRFPRLYAPRTYIGVIPEKDRTPSESTSRFAWAHTLAALGDKFVLEHSSLDAYLFLRFLRTIVYICFIASCISWPILFPVNATGGGTATQLDRFGFGNVHDPKRLYAHAVVAWVLYGFVMLVVASERLWLIGLRQAWYLSKRNASRLSSRTVLYLDPKGTIRADDDVQPHFGDEALRQWVVTPISKLDNHVASRDSRALELEAAEVSFLTSVVKKKAKLNQQELPEQNVRSLRPVHKPYRLVGTSVDAIKHLRGLVKEAETKVDNNRIGAPADADQHRSPSAVIVEYRDLAAAQRAYRGKAKFRIPGPPNLAAESKLTGVHPKEIIWSNLERPQAVRLSGRTAANLLVAAMIVFWSIPIAFVGTISNVHYLASHVEWLHWIDRLPDPVLGLLSGLLPPFLTSFLASYVPNIMRYIARWSGEPTVVTAELQVQSWYYAFQVIQVFLVTALSSSATKFIPQIINNPDEIPLMLADSLPSSSNFYLTYFVLQGIGSSAQNLLNYSDLFQYLFFDMFINKTPRQKYSQYTNLKGIPWGKLFPKFTNFAIIALAYSCISPLVLGFATAGLYLFYLCYRHQLLFVVQPKVDTKGKCYTRALQQVLTGVYIGELCLIGLFGLRKATGPSIMMIVLFALTIAYNIIMNQYLLPLEDHLPEYMLESLDDEDAPLLAAEQGQTGSEEEETSQAHSLNIRTAPKKAVDFFTRTLKPQISASHHLMKAYLAKYESEDPQYSDEQIRNAYVNPSLTSKTSKLWLPSDGGGLSTKEIEDNFAEGIQATDDGAWIDEKGRVQFDKENLQDLPVWKKNIPY